VADDLTLSEPGQFKALGHPLRHRLLLALRQRAATSGQLAEALTSTKGTVGYHLKVLLDAGLVRIAHTRTVRGGTEQYYEPTAPSLRIAPAVPDGGAFLVRAALGEMLPARPGAPDVTVLRHLRLSSVQARELARELEHRATSAAGDEAGESYGLLLSLYRADVPRLPDE
jgi:DNA-binding transcriptional ArsR family regulator